MFALSMRLTLTSLAPRLRARIGMKVKVDIHTPYWVTALRSDGKRTSLRTIRCPSELHDGAFGGRLFSTTGINMIAESTAAATAT